jgi:DNA-binding response OmpR family regulator
MSEGKQILLVDDEEPIRLTLSTLLRRAGYDVTTASSGEDAVALLDRQRYDVLIADLKMPGIDGMAVVRAAQERDLDTVCLILTGHGSLESAIEGLRRDIFDYLLKTSDPQEVLRRVQAAVQQREQIRRRKQMLQTLVSAASELGAPAPQPLAEAVSPRPAPSPSSPSGILAVGPLRIDPLRQEVVLDGRTVVLTPTELRVLVCLAQHAGTMLSYVDLVQCAQGYETYPSEAAELVKPHMHHLRQKLEADPAHPRYLLNVRGTGYLLALDEAPSEP